MTSNLHTDFHLSYLANRGAWNTDIQFSWKKYKIFVCSKNYLNHSYCNTQLLQEVNNK